MKKLQLVLLSMFITVTGMGQAYPSLIEVSAENWEGYYNSDFKDVLGFVSSSNGEIDTVMLMTGGFVYTTMDTFPLVINSEIIIMAAPGLTEKPIFAHSNPDSDATMEIFRICESVKFEGISFVGNTGDLPPVKYALRYGDFENPGLESILLAESDIDITLKDCDFTNFHEDGDQNRQGNVLFFQKPLDVTKDHIHADNVIIEGCTFTDIGDECIRISENEKYPVGSSGTIPYDTLIVRNCTFDDIDAECVRIYGDTDTSFVGPTYQDGLTLIEKCTVVNSAPRFIYAKNYRQTIVRDVLIANGREPSINRQDRGDYVMHVQLSSSYIANIDTFDLTFTMYAEDRVQSGKGGEVDVATVYGYDPQFTDAANANYEVNSPYLYSRGSDGGFIGDPRWATNRPPVATTPETKPASFTLEQNYPNPFNPSTTINFSIERPDFTSLVVFNVLGQVVATLKNEFMWEGNHSVTFDASEIAGGVYFYELRQGNNSSINKMILLK